MLRTVAPRTLDEQPGKRFNGDERQFLRHFSQFPIQCVRVAKAQKADLILRQYPLTKCMEAIPKLTSYVLLHPEPIVHQAKRKFCFCKTTTKKANVGCDECFEWYHEDCIGQSVADIKQMDNWKCGYCLEPPPGDGNCEWKIPIPQGGRRRQKKAPPRNINETPMALGRDYGCGEMEEVGPKSWSDIVKYTEEQGKAINIKLAKFRAQAAKLVKDAGHHIGDTVSGGGLEVRGVDDLLVDDFLGLGIMDDDDVDA